MVNPMTRKRLDNLDPDRQELLFRNAAEEFAAHGYDAASLNNILDRAGMSKSSLYYYFDGKADLFATLIERAIGLILREVGGFDPARLTARTFWPELAGLAHRFVAVSGRNAWFVKVGRLFYRLRGREKGRDPTARTFQAARLWVGALIERGQSLGVVRSDLPLDLLIEMTMAVGEAMDRWLVARWDDMSADERLTMTDRQVALVRQMLSPAAPDAPTAPAPPQAR